MKFSSAGSAQNHQYAPPSRPLVAFQGIRWSRLTSSRACKEARLQHHSAAIRHRVVRRTAIRLGVAGRARHVLKLERGTFGFTDMYGARLKSDRKLICELTLRDGRVVFDLNGRSVTPSGVRSAPRLQNA